MWRLAILAGILLGALPWGLRALAQPPGLHGKASYYDRNYKGRVASGARYDPDKFTAAHRSLPFGTRLRVTDRRSRRSVTVVVNDRGPFVGNRVLDLSFAAAKELRMLDRGVIEVEAERIFTE